jgi:hypothetical protein
MRKNAMRANLCLTFLALSSFALQRQYYLDDSGWRNDFHLRAGLKRHHRGRFRNCD